MKFPIGLAELSFSGWKITYFSNDSVDLNISLHYIYTTDTFNILKLPIKHVSKTQMNINNPTSKLIGNLQSLFLFHLDLWV